MAKNLTPQRGTRTHGWKLHAVSGTTLLAGLISQAYAQQPAAAAPAAAASAPAKSPVQEGVQTVEITGYAASLAASAKDKRDATGFIDTVSAEDIGKFPDSDIAESLARVPGVQLTREITGEGIQISVRGLGSNFSKVLLNGSSIAVASSGRTDAQNSNREVDLDLLPADLFSKLSVYKSPTADLLEGGTAGVVDMRSVRAFDNPGRHFVAALAGTEQQVDGKMGNKGTFIASDTWGHQFGVLGGLSFGNAKVRTTGYETVGLTNAALSATQDTASNRGSTGGGNWTVPATVPATAVTSTNGLTAGQTIDQAFLLTQNPNASISQIDNAILPRLGRTMNEQGTKDRISGVLNAQYQPNDDLKFYLDTIFARKQNKLEREDMDWSLRNSAGIPTNLTADNSNCANGCVANTVTMANTGFFLEYRPYVETTKLWSVNPGMDWKLGDKLHLDAQANASRSTFVRDAPTVLVATALTSVNFNNNNGDVPTISSGIDLDNPANFSWSGGRLNVQDELRTTSTKGARTNLSWGDDSFKIKGGLAFDEVARMIHAKDNSTAYQTAAEAAVPSSSLGNYLTPGPQGFITLNWAKFAQDTNYAQYDASAPEAKSSATSTSEGSINEKSVGAYVETDGKVFSDKLRYDAGVRFVHTDQDIGAPLTVGSNQFDWTYIKTDYHEILPSATLAYSFTDNLVARTSLSKTMSRANPSALLPGINFSDPSAATGTLGNSALKPYMSTNFDLGLDWYTGKEGYISLTHFEKRIAGFTTNQNVTHPFTDLAAYGVTYATLSATQQAAIDARGGPNTATVVMTEQINAPGLLDIHGTEIGIQESLDHYLPVPGFGFTGNVTLVHQNSQLPGAVATGVPRFTDNWTIYYEHYGYMARVSQSFAQGSIASGFNQNGITNAAIFNDPYRQTDVSLRFDLEDIFGISHAPQLSVDINNVTGAKQRQYFQFKAATYTEYKPGRVFSVGLREEF